MSGAASLKEKLGKDVFKPGADRHIGIRPGLEQDPRLRRAVLLCPSGLYALGDDGAVTLTLEGCLECGTCRIACGPEVLEWTYPPGGAGVQFRFG
jgi:ferredoxin like protein